MKNDELTELLSATREQFEQDEQRFVNNTLDYVEHAQNSSRFYRTSLVVLSLLVAFSLIGISSWIDGGEPNLVSPENGFDTNTVADMQAATESLRTFDFSTNSITEYLASTNFENNNNVDILSLDQGFEALK